MSKKSILIVIFAAGIAVLGMYLFKQINFESSDSIGSIEHPTAEHPIEIDWWTLKELDWKTGQKSKKLEDLEGKPVRLPGFVVPLEDEQRIVKEFLFVPTLQACIHVPPPPPNQMIYVTMDEGFEFDWGFRAFWLTGVLQIVEKKSAYGQASFQMKGLKMLPYHKGL